MSDHSPTARATASSVTADVSAVFGALIEEACAGATDPASTWITDQGSDHGLLGVCRGLSAEAASLAAGGGHSIAGHVNHVAFGLEFLRAAAERRKPEGDWAASWSPEQVDELQWQACLARLRAAIDGMKATLAGVETWDEVRLKAAISAAAHSAYHLGVVRAHVARLRAGGAR